MSTTPLRPDERPGVVLHLGMGKTGTSSIQAWLHRNRARLAGLGVLFPESPGKRRHTRLGLAMQPDEARRSSDWRHQEEVGPSALRPVFEEQLLAEIRAAHVPRLLLSDEALSGAPDGALTNLRGFLDDIAAAVRVVVYLRRQDDHLCSRYQQVVKFAGMVRRLAERADQMEQARLYDYHARLDTWRTLLRPEELVVRRFERSSFAGGSLHHDFLEATGLDLRAEDLEDGPTRNESLDAESVEFLRLLNLRQREDDRPAPGMPPRIRIIRRLARASSGPVLTLPEDRREQFMARWVETNRAVAQEYFPDGPETLFESARKSRGTTSEQYLDPGRLDHFLEVTGLPSELREPLRRLAETEATR